MLDLAFTVDDDCVGQSTEAIAVFFGHLYRVLVTNKHGVIDAIAIHEILHLAFFIDGNGFNGWKENGKFDRILISASSSFIPEHLFSQLKEDGIIVCPVKESIFQIKKENEEISKKEFPGFLFVPLKES